MEFQVTSLREQNLTQAAEVWAVRLGLLCHLLGGVRRWKLASPWGAGKGHSGASQPDGTPCPVRTNTPEQGPCRICTPGPQLPGGEILGRTPAFVSLSLPVCAVGLVLPDHHGVIGTLDKCLALSTEQSEAPPARECTKQRLKWRASRPSGSTEAGLQAGLGPRLVQGPQVQAGRRGPVLCPSTWLPPPHHLSGQ